MFPGNALPESTYTCKCDYVDSSMACNVSLCKIANDTLYGRGFTVAQRDNPMRRTATYGHAIELVNIVDNVEISLGAYTIIIDRYAEKSMGYDKKEYPNILIAEGESNSDTGASSLHAYTNPESSGSQFANETEYINEGFKIVYPPTNEAAYDFADLKELVNFVDLASEDDFKDTFESYFNKESVLKYYLFCLCFASVDTLAKNLHFARYTDVWYILPYDLDSVLGGSNVGFLNISSSCEVGNVYDEKNPEVIVEPNQFNSWNGRLWARIRNIFAADLTAMWTTLRSNGTFNYDNFIKYFDEIWDAIPPTMYNSSQQIKYIDYGTTGQVALHGNRKHQIKKFLRERLAYLDSKFGFYSDGGAENYANIRMNVLGDVSLTIETYYPVYYTIKWATNNIETHRIAKNTKYTFSYFSDVSTDREVLLYLPHTLKSIENLDSLQPASIDVSKATKLTKLEVHSEKLYSVNVTNNKYLRTIDFNGCKLLGTDTISTLSILYAKYLKYLDVRGTQLTAVNFSPQGGSIVDCYLPNTITSLTVQNQLLLTNLIIPGGENTPRDLATVTIDNCPLITKLSDTESSYPFDVFKYCRTLNINNSFLTMNEIVFDGFTRLQSVSLSNMEALTDLGLNDLCVKGETSTLRYIGISSCKNLTELSLNCTSNNYEIAFANSSLLDLSTSNVTELRSNCVMKGLNTIVLPVCIENMYFTNEYGTGYSDVRNIWSASTAVVDTSGVFPVARHMNYNTNIVDEYEGIDFYGLHLYNIDLGALVNIPDAINFSLYPTSVNPNFNLNRDGVEHPFLQPTGVLDLSDYTESLAKFFNGVDLDKLYVACRNDLPQTDLSYCFYGSSFSSPARLNNILNHITTVSNMEYCFYGTSTSNIDVLSSVNFLPGTSLRYCFAGCPNITELSDVVLSSNIGDASYMFSGSGLRSINNVSTSCGTIVGMFSNCDNLVEVNNFTASATTSYESLFEGCGGMTVAPIVEIPSTIVNISKMYKDCSSLVSIDGMVLHGNITDTTEFIADCNNLINANNVTIAGSFYNDIFRGATSIKYVNNLLIKYVGRSMTFAHMFDGCTNLVEMSFHDDSYVKDVISMDYMFRGTSMRTVDFSNVNLEKVVSYKYMFADCLMEEFSFTVPRTITSIQGILSNCRNLKTLRNFNISHNVTATDWMLDTPIENLINCSFYNQNTSFKNNTTLKKIEGFNYTGNNLANYFEECSNLQSAELKLGSNVSKANNLFANCPLLTSVEFNSESDLSNVTTISDMFNGDNSLTTIKNLKITNSSTIANNTTLSNCHINNTDGLYINSNSAIQMFRMGTESKIIQFTDFELGASCNNLSNAFRDYPLLIKDILLPPHVVDVSYAFSNCIAMENIVSNWTNLYDRNNDDDLSDDVITEGCYEGSNNIKYIDNELYMNEYGELTAMQYIPPEWGGNASYEDNQTVFDVKITADNLTYTMLGNVGECKTNWGDGAEDMNISHEYSKPGTYTIITENTQTFAQGTVVDSSISSPIVKFRALNKSLTNGSHLFDGWTNLLKVNKLTNTFDSYDYMFNNCSKLVDVDLSGCTLSQTVTTMAYMCNGCSKFTKLPISVIPDTCTNISYLFADTSITDISGLTFGSRISNITSWVPPKITTANNVTVRCSQPLFKGSTALVSIDNFTISSNVRNISSLFEGCAKLSKDFDIPLYITDCSNTFKGCISMTHVHSNWNKTYTNSITPTDCYAGCTGITHIDGENIIIYEGKEGLDEVPEAWGGHNFSLEETCVFKVEIPSDNYELIFIGMPVTDRVEDTNLLTSWGDGTFNNSNYHIYEKSGTYIVKTKFNNMYTWNTKNTLRKTLVEILQTRTKNCRMSLRDCMKLRYWNLDNCDVATNSMVYHGASHGLTISAKNVKFNNNIPWFSTGSWGHIFTQETIESWDLSKLTKMEYLFCGCGNEIIDLTNVTFNSNITTMRGMFKECGKLKQVISLDKINTSNIISTNEMFSYCVSLESLNLNYFNMSKVTDTYNMFIGCSSLKTIDLSNWDVRNLQNSSNMFSQCSSLEDIIGLENWELNSVTNMSGMFDRCSILNITNRITTMKINSGVKDISRLFYYCKGMSNIDLSNWYLDGVINMSYTFSEMSILTEIKIPNFNLVNLTNINYAFTNVPNLTNLEFGYNLNIEFGYSNIKYCTKLTQGSVVSLLNGLYDRSGTTTLRAEIGSTLIAKLTSDQIAITTNKNWTVI